MTKNHLTKGQRIKKAKKDFIEHVKSTNRSKQKNLRKQEKIKIKAAEELRFRQHVGRLLNPEAETRFS